MRVARETRLASMAPTSPTISPSHPQKANSKSARAYAKSYRDRTGPPLVPAIILTHLTEYISRIVLRKKQIFLLSCCKYWSLKREARRGAPLLKRLHLEVCYVRVILGFSKWLMYSVVASLGLRARLENIRVKKPPKSVLPFVNRSYHPVTSLADL